MPTLIRFAIVLVVFAGVALGAMYALTLIVDPRQKEVTIRLPASDLVPARTREPLVRREIDTTRTPDSPPPAPPAAADEEPGVVTLAPGTE